MVRGRPPGRPRKARASIEELEANRKARIDLELSIESMAGNGLSVDQISLLTGLKVARLYRRYRESLLRGGARKLHSVAEMGHLLATGGPERDWRRADAGMIKFWLDRQGGPQWASKGGGGEEGYDLSRLTTDELVALERALRPLRRLGGGPELIDVTPAAGERDQGGGGDEAED